MSVASQGKEEPCHCHLFDTNRGGRFLCGRLRSVSVSGFRLREWLRPGGQRSRPMHPPFPSGRPKTSDQPAASARLRARPLVPGVAKDPSEECQGVSSGGGNH